MGFVNIRRACNRPDNKVLMSLNIIYYLEKPHREYTQDMRMGSPGNLAEGSAFRYFEM